MRKYLQILSFLCVMLLCIPVCAHGKKKQPKAQAPEWTHSSVPGYVISSATGGDQQDAKDRCFRNIQSEILNSVAVNISSTSTFSSESYTEGDVTSTRQAYQDNIKTVAAHLPFLTGLTTANADIWMEEFEGGWRCFMKYPFSRFDQERLVEQFLAYDKEKSEQLDSLKKVLTSFTDIDKISAYIAEVETLKTYFFDMLGMEVQINIVSAETMRAAQKDPASYKDLVVRIAGFSVYFVEMHRTGQNDLISRTENNL